MKVDKLPITAYDAVSYFTPGALFLMYVAYAFHKHTVVALSAVKELNAVVLVSLALLLIVAAYIAGHIISLFASFTLERLALGFTGYPSLYLARSGAYADHESSKFGDIVGVVVAKNVDEKKREFGFLFLKVTCFPFYWALLLVGRFKFWAHLIKPEASSTIDRLDDLYLKRFNARRRDVDGWFVLVEYFSLYRNKIAAQRMYNYLNLYGFCRNSAFAMYAGAGILFIGIISSVVTSMMGGLVERGIILTNSFLLVSSILISVMLYLGFIKFYRRYSHEAIMAFVIMDVETASVEKDGGE